MFHGANKTDCIPAFSHYNSKATQLIKLVLYSQNDVFQKSADLGDILSKIVVESIKAFTAANNELMQGHNFEDSGDIRAYMQGGLFVDYGGVNKNALVDVTNNLLTGNAINELYRTQKIYIMGGAPCNDDTLGPGPANAVVCRNGLAWYLYYWEEPDHLILNSHKWGWTNPPPGFDQLGKDDYAGVTVEVDYYPYRDDSSELKEERETC